jgi:hypothetical protein
MLKGGRRKKEDAKYVLLVLLLASSVFLPACGKKGPPRAPLNLVPQPPAVTARRLGDTVILQMSVPTTNANGPGAASIDRLEVYAVSVAAGIPAPANRDLLKPAYRIGKIDVRPPEDPDAPPPPEDAKPDTRPKPGDTTMFVEKLTPATTTPQITEAPQPKNKKKGTKDTKGTKEPPAATGATPGAAAAPGTPPPPALPQVPTRVYVVEGVAPNGHAGAPSARITVPLVTPPPPIQGTPSLTASESSIILNWNPPPSATDEALGVTYNIYAVPPPNAANEPKDTKESKATKESKQAPKPLNDKPIEELTFEHPGAEPGKEQCFTVRSVATVENAAIESDPSQPACITPKDVFPPAPPKNLAVVAGGEGRMNLIWDANSEADLAGYVVLRGENPDRLAPLTKDPIRETRYTDSTATAGATYVYAIVAVDKAGNRSQPSNKVTETAR